VPPDTNLYSDSRLAHIKRRVPFYIKQAPNGSAMMALAQSHVPWLVGLVEESIRVLSLSHDQVDEETKAAIQKTIKAMLVLT
jgi:hypothetical protein